MPIFREAPLAVVRELYEQEPEPPVLVTDGLGLPGEDSNKLPVSIEVNEVPTTPEVAAAEEGLNEEGAPEPAGNFRITDEALGAGGPKQKFARNIKAIKTLFTLEQEHRGATTASGASRKIGIRSSASAMSCRVTLSLSKSTLSTRNFRPSMWTMEPTGR